MNGFLKNLINQRVYQVAVILFFLYTTMVIVFSPNQLKHDEPRYFSGAQNLTKGFFVHADHPDFTNGPGYPLLLAPLVAISNFDFDRLVQDPGDYEFYLPDGDGEYVENLKWRLLPMRLLNPFLLTAGFLVIYHASRLLVSDKFALLVALVVSLNPFQLRFVAYMMTENVTPLLFGCFAWIYIKKIIRSETFSWKWTLLAGLAFCALALTRTIFGYVALVALISIPVLCLIERKPRFAGIAAAPFAAALIFCIPYLAYTQKHTGEFFCWATNSGELAYWITSPHEGEFGSWLQEKWIVKDPLLAKNHLDFVQSIHQLPFREQHDAWMEGVRKHLDADNIIPALARNYFANLCRVFFNVPRSRTFEKFPKLVWTLTGAAIAFGMFASTLPTLMRWKQVPFELKILLMCLGIYFCGVLLLPAEPRYLVPVFPLIFLWIAYVFDRLVNVTVELKK